MKYRKKPVIIEAFKLTKETEFDSLPEWAKEAYSVDETVELFRFYLTPDGANINTLENQMSAKWGDYIIQGVRGEIYSCRGDIFIETYEEAE